MRNLNDEGRAEAELSVVFEPAAVAGALARLGLRREVLVEAVLAGEAARDSCTANDPLIAPGFMSWARTTRGLREQLVPTPGDDVRRDLADEIDIAVTRRAL